MQNFFYFSRNESPNGTTINPNNTTNSSNNHHATISFKSNDDSSNANMPSITIKTNDNGKIPTITIKPTLPKSKTQISSIYTKLSSIKPTATTAPAATSQPSHNHHNPVDPKSNGKISSSIPNFSNKTVKTTQIGNVLPIKLTNGNTKSIKKPELSPINSKKVSQLVKPQIVLTNGSPKGGPLNGTKNGTKTILKKTESDGNSQSSLSSSDSSLNTNHRDLVDLKNEYNSVQNGKNGIANC